jgi:inhibitor of cysteine peptidase
MKRFSISACVLLSTVLSASFALARTVIVTQSDNGSRQSLAVGDTLVVRLKSNATTGYRWYRNPAAGKLGQGGSQIFTFTVVKPGRTSLSLVYRRPFGTHAAPAKTFSLDISIVPAGVTAFAQADRPEAEPNKIDGVLVGRYFGVLPCTDCSGINETLALYAKGTGELVASRYQLQMVYRGAPGGDKTMRQTGEWIVLYGTRADPDAVVYQLNPEKPAEVSNYLLKGDSLTPLDRMQRPIVAPMTLSLRRER